MREELLIIRLADAYRAAEVGPAAEAARATLARHLVRRPSVAALVTHAEVTSQFLRMTVRANWLAPNLMEAALGIVENLEEIVAQHRAWATAP